MATHSSTLAWKIPWMEEPGRLLSMGLQRVRHDERFHFTSLPPIEIIKGVCIDGHFLFKVLAALVLWCSLQAFPHCRALALQLL